METLSAKLASRLQGWRGDLLALVGGLLTPLAFAPLEWWPLAVVGPALLFLLWQFCGPRRAALRGLLFGLGMFGLGINWVFISIHYHGFVPLFLSILLTIALVLVMAMFPALVGYLLVRFWPRRYEQRYARIKLLLALPALWTLGEWVRGWFMTGFPWLSLGYSQVDSPLAGLAPLVGTYGVSWVVALIAALLVALLLDGRRRLIYAVAFAGVWAGAWGLSQVQWTTPVGKPLKVSLLQGNIPQDMKWLPEMRVPTIELYTDLTRQHWDSDLIIWPESALPAFQYEVESFLDDLAQEGRDNNTDLLIGMLELDPQRREYFNAMVGLGKDDGIYYKDHLVPFTEYLPLKSVLGGLVQFMQVPMSDFSSGGTDQAPLAVAGQRVGISICFEDAFGEEVIRALPEATLLVNVSNDAWFDDSWAPPQHLQMARMRALETGRPMLRGTNTGITAVINARGALQSVAPQFETTVLTDTVQPRQGMTFYAYTGNFLVVIMALGLLFTARRITRQV